MAFLDSGILGGSLKVGGASPLDGKAKWEGTFVNLQSSVPLDQCWEGMIVYVTDDKKHYKLTTKGVTSATNVWTEFGAGALNPLDYDLSEFTNTSVNPFVQQDELDDYIPLTQKGAANGVAPTGVDNKIPLSFLPDAILGQVVFGGTVVPATGVATLSANAKTKLGTTDATITLTNNTTPITGYEANEGIYYIASDHGVFGSISFEVGDWLISTGGAWTIIDNTDSVKMVDGDIGDITTQFNVMDGDYISLSTLSKPRTLITFDHITSNGTLNLPNPATQTGKLVMISGKTSPEYTVTVGVSGALTGKILLPQAAVDNIKVDTNGYTTLLISDGVYWRVFKEEILAQNVSYNNLTSGLDAENVQEAVDEVQGNIEQETTDRQLAIETAGFAQRTGTEIHFDKWATYDSYSSPSDGNFSYDLTNAVVGMIQVAYHEDSLVPTFSQVGIDVITIGEYQSGIVNRVVFELIGASRILVNVTPL